MSVPDRDADENRLQPCSLSVYFQVKCSFLWLINSIRTGSLVFLVKKADEYFSQPS